jgi:hypothetical protein
LPYVSNRKYDSFLIEGALKVKSRGTAAACSWPCDLIPDLNAILTNPNFILTPF